MKSLVITPRNQSESKFLVDFFEKIGLPSKAISAEELEDMGLSKMLNEVDKSQKVSREIILQKLQSK